MVAHRVMTGIPPGADIAACRCSPWLHTSQVLSGQAIWAATEGPDNVLTALQDVGYYPGAAVNVQVRCGDGHGSGAVRRDGDLLAHRGDRTHGMDLGAQPASFFIGMPAVEDPIAIRPDPIAYAWPRPLREELGGTVAPELIGEDTGLPLDVQRVWETSSSSSLSFPASERMGKPSGTIVSKRRSKIRSWDSCTSG